jgi:predicted acyl esterase
MGARVWVAAAAALLIGAAPAAAMDVRGSAKQVDVTDATAGAQAQLVNGKGKVVRTQKVNALGGLLFRNVKAGKGYTVKVGGDASKPVNVFQDAAAPPSTDVYNQTIQPSGYQYLKTRDGTQLAIDVHPATDIADVSPTGNPLPDMPSISPTPTLIEYAGYGYANPSGPESGIAVIANLMGFTVVDVNMRGTGCSGGAFDFFEPLQGLDGYDVIETIAHQSWVRHGKVGMMGISYGGISQLFTAQYNPPSLAAIAPLSVIDATQTTLYPGGILNTGFALNWAKERVHDAQAAGPDNGQKWAYQKIQDGDATCKANQALHPEAIDLLKKVRQNNHYVPKVADPLSPVTFVNKIKVPVFMACQWTDEQTGGHCPTLAEHMTGTDKKWFTYTNGAHIDSLDPETFNRWYDFLKIYVAQQPPSSNSAVIQGGAPVVYQQAMGVNGVTLPTDPIQSMPTLEQAQAAFEKYKSVRVLFDNGAGRDPGQPYPGFEQSFDKFPVPGTKAKLFFFDKNTLTPKPPKQTSTSSFTWNPKARTPTDFTGDTAGGTNGLWTAAPPYKWQIPPAGTAVTYTTAPLSDNVVAVGAGAVKVQLKANKPNVDLQATISEVRPDGKEVFVQGGWLRANERKLDPKSTALEPVLSLRKQDVQRLPKNRFVEATIPLYYEGHAYRKGSQIRVTISAPGADQPIWAFKTNPNGTAKVAIRSSKKKPSSLMLASVPDVAVPTGLPPCPGLRGEPCRDAGQ